MGEEPSGEFGETCFGEAFLAFLRVRNGLDIFPQRQEKRQNPPMSPGLYTHNMTSVTERFCKEIEIQHSIVAPMLQESPDGSSSPLASYVQRVTELLTKNVVRWQQKQTSSSGLSRG